MKRLFAWTSYRVPVRLSDTRTPVDSGDFCLNDVIEGAVPRWLMAFAGALAVYLVVRMTVLPALHLGFYADDFFYLDWTSHLSWRSWLGLFFEPGPFSITYRPLAAVVYLVYLTGNAFSGYLALSALFLTNVGLIFLLCRKLSGTPFAFLTSFFFIGSFIYYDATHRIYNLITQTSALFFLISMLAWWSSTEPNPRAGARRVLSWLFYAGSLATYEITFLGCGVVFGMALLRQLPARRGAVVDALFRALAAATPFAAVAAVYAGLNILNPIKAEHLTAHATPIALSSIPAIGARLWINLKTSLSWIVTVDRRAAFIEHLDLEFLLLAVCLVPTLGFLLWQGVKEHKSRAPAVLGHCFGMALFGFYWFVVIVSPSALSSYFDYRLTFLAYAGIAMMLAAGLLFTLQSMRLAFGQGQARSVNVLLAIVLGLSASLWLMSNVALSETMDRNLIVSGRLQRQLLASLKPYLGYIDTDSVMAVRYNHQALRALPYVYQASPFPEDFGLRYALRYYYGKNFADANLFFEPHEDHFTIGRFAAARKSYRYDRLVLFDFDGTHLVRQENLEVAGNIISLASVVRAGKSK